MTQTTVTLRTAHEGVDSGTAPRTGHRAFTADRAVRPALAVLLALTAVLYLWDLSASGWANSFYSAAVQAGSASWKAFFFGSSDAANSITVDKTPLALWPMMLSVRMFGLNSWAILVPQALMGVGSVALLHATVRRHTGNAWAGIAAGAMLAVTPVATLMFRFNNPDAALVLLMIAAVYATVRALQSPRHAMAWIALGGAFVGLAFLAKMLQAFLVLPGLAGVYLLFASVPLAKRFGHLVVAFVSMIVAGGWWIAIVELWPAGSRPYIGGSQHNSILELALGYNGVGRLNGDETGSVGSNGNWGSTGLGRMFNSEIGGQIGWLLPAALILLLAGLWFAARRGGRTDAHVAGLTVWGGWLLVTWLTFSFMAGIFHAYYTVALAPAIAAVIAIAGHTLWQHRTDDAAALVAAFTLATTATLAFVLLGRSSDFVPWLKWIVIVAGVVAAALVAIWKYLPREGMIAVAIAASVAVLAGPLSFSVATAQTAHTGSIPTAGPSSSGGMGMAMGTGRSMGGSRTGTGGGGGVGGLLNGSTSSSQVTALLKQNASDYTWVAATVGSNNASGYQLATKDPVMAIGGFNGTDPSPTLAQFKKYVAEGRIHYYIASSTGGFGGSSSSGTASSITAWVQQNFTAKTVDGVTLYDLSEGTN